MDVRKLAMILAALLAASTAQAEERKTFGLDMDAMFKEARRQAEKHGPLPDWPHEWLEQAYERCPNGKDYCPTLVYVISKTPKR